MNDMSLQYIIELTNESNRLKELLLDNINRIVSAYKETDNSRIEEALITFWENIYFKYDRRKIKFFLDYNKKNKIYSIEIYSDHCYVLFIKFDSIIFDFVNKSELIQYILHMKNSGIIGFEMSIIK